jgi:lipopolysaccharide transport system ATP-binding protein
MSDTVIRVENLGKRYTLRHQAETRYVALRDVIATRAKSLVRRLAAPTPNPKPQTREEFWALKDVSFEVKQGDRVGIIGRNGAGKSTLLKILSRITEPTRGRIAIRGRVASLLEVGTGFHPELTGRENIYLNGAVLGMTKAEIKRKFDEIVAFAEVEKFLDTPVKHYSSGMYVRLAFAVAAHLESEILVVDEVLAVGDAQFQKKCLGKMEDVSKKQGRTVLFVSHSMGTIAQLCDQTLMLQQGKIVQQGETKAVISFYLENFSLQGSFFQSHSSQAKKNIYISEAQLLNISGASTSEFGHIEPIYLVIRCTVNRAVRGCVLGISVKDRLGRKVFSSQTDSHPDIENLGSKSFVATVKIPENFLTPGYYSVFIGLHVPMIEVLDQLDEACEFKITDVGSELALYEGLDYGCVFAKCQWKVESL